MRLALITPYLPSPANTGGRIRIHRLARALAARADVSLYACAGRRETESQRKGPELGFFSSVRDRNSDWGAVPALLTSRRVRKSCPARLARDLARDHAALPFDALVVEHSYALATARGIVGVPVIVDEHNVESRYQSQYLESRQRQTGYFARREVDLLRRWETHTWQRADLVTCVSEADHEAIRQVRSGPVCVVPNGTNLDDIPFVSPLTRVGHEVLFVGLMSHAPNVSAALWLAHEVMPRVWHSEPRATLVLCGRTPAREVRALASERVVVTDTVPSVVPYLSRARVYANALRHGAGSSLKVPEALASGVPMVSTSVGARGFPLEPAVHYRAAETAEDFAHGVVASLRTAPEDEARALRAREVAARFDWGPIARSFADAVVALAQR